MPNDPRRFASAMPGWPTAALAVLGALSLAQCGGRAESSSAGPREDRDAAADSAIDVAESSTDAIATPIDATYVADASTDVIVPIGGVCPVMIISEDAAVDAPDDVVVPHAGIC